MALTDSSGRLLSLEMTCFSAKDGCFPGHKHAGGPESFERKVHLPSCNYNDNFLQIYVLIEKFYNTVISSTDVRSNFAAD